MNVLKDIRSKAKSNLKKVVFPEGIDPRVIKAAEVCQKENYVIPVILGNHEKLLQIASQAHADISKVEIVDPETDPRGEEYGQNYFELRKSKGMDLPTATQLIKDPLRFAAMLVRTGYASASVAGSVATTGDVLRAAIQIIGVAPGCSIVSSIFLMCLKDQRCLSYGDCAVVPDPTPEQLADIAIASAETHKYLTGETPVVALLSFSTKGSAEHPLVAKVQEATQIAQRKQPSLCLDGELQADAALVESIGRRKAPKSPVAGKANVLIFPDLQAGNIGYKLTERLAGAQAIGPVIQGLAKPANDLSRGCSYEDIINVACICSIKAA
jgi:phosphate acetyltransferase